MTLDQRVRGLTALVASVAAVWLSFATAAAAQPPQEPDRRPKVTLRATPPIGVTPLRVVLTAELTGGANDFEDYYCPTVEWDWGDDTRSESTSDCEPYEAGKSEIRRRFTVEHTFRRPGAYKIFLRLKRRDKVVLAAYTNIQVRPGAPSFEP
jgi:hypothetical protein